MLMKKRYAIKISCTIFEMNVYDVGGAVTVEEIDASELTDKELQELIEEEAAIRFIGPRNNSNPVAGHVLSVTILFLLATMVVLV